MGKANSDANGNGKMVPADCVSVLLMAIGNTSVSKSQYEIMSALDGTRTASSFEHQFRTITQKARELKQRVEDGEQFVAVQPHKKRGAADSTLTPPDTPMKKPKATPKPRAKSKATPKPRAKKSKAKVDADAGLSPSNDLGDGEAFANGVDDMIKQEQEWGEDFC